MKKARFQAFVLLAMAVWLLSCQRKPPVTGMQVEPGASDQGSVRFDVSPVDGGPGIRQWRATYTADGKSAKFRIEFGATKPSSGILFGQGKFLAEPGSDASTFLQSLNRALEAKSLPSHVERVQELPFQLAIIGDNLSRASGGASAPSLPVTGWSPRYFWRAGKRKCF